MRLIAEVIGAVLLIWVAFLGALAILARYVNGPSVPKKEPKKETEE